MSLIIFNGYKCKDVNNFNFNLINYNIIYVLFFLCEMFE